MLEINDLKKTFENGSPALKGVNLKINKGDIVKAQSASREVLKKLKIKKIKINKKKNSIKNEMPYLR